MSIYITIDGGTTNTRVSLVCGGSLVDTVKLSVGARKSIASRDALISSLRLSIQALLERNHLSENDVSCILASGMITSEFGLCHLEHIAAPAGVAELHNSIKQTEISEISSIPFSFIRGVKIPSESFERFDVMRGEETELMGLIDPEFCDNVIYVLPGSHSKIIRVDAFGRIVDFSTMMTGEMIAALSQNTILKDAIDLQSACINEEYLIKGYDFCAKEGINKALFKTRVLKTFMDCEKDAVYSFFLGSILSPEIEKLVEAAEQKIVIGGRKQIRDAMSIILKKRSDKDIICLDDATVDASTCIGAVRIFENRQYI